MNKKLNNKNIILLVILIITLFPIEEVKAEKGGVLKPCFNILTSSYTFNEYFYNLREVILNQSDPADSGEIARYIVGPSFQEEEYIAIYKNSEQEYILEHIKPNFPIWASLQKTKIPDEHKDKNIPKTEDIKTTTIKKIISQKLALTILDVWSSMTKETAITPKSDVAYLDGTILYFTYGTVQCGMSLSGLEGENIRSLVAIGDKLIEYSNAIKPTAEQEEEISNLAQSLLLQNKK